MLEGMFIALRGLWLVLVEHQLDTARRMLADAGLLTDERQVELDAIRDKLIGLNLPSVDDLRNDWDAAEARGRARVTGPAPTIVPADSEVIEAVPEPGAVVARAVCPNCDGTGKCEQLDADDIVALGECGLCGGQGLV